MNEPANTSEYSRTEAGCAPNVSEDAVRAYVADYECLMAGVSTYLELGRQVSEEQDMSALRKHHEAHPEDSLCHIKHPVNGGMLLCTRAGMEAIQRMAKRLVAEAPNGEDVGDIAITEAIADNIAQVMLDQVTDDYELIRRLKSYVLLTEAKHASITHHFPCVIMQPMPNNEISGGPLQDTFSLGPVIFQHAPVFLQNLDAAKARTDHERTIEYFAEPAEKYGWVASVSMPSCAPDVSRKRAEDVVETAINILKVSIGLGYANSMSLPHVSAARDRQTCVLTETDGKYEWTYYGQSMQGARVQNDLFANLPSHFTADSSRLLTACLSGTKAEAANRLVDALRWFGDASFEQSCGVKVSKWVAALERLTTTGHFMTHTFCVRVALLTSNLDFASIDRSYRDARTVYQLRCDVMHGSRSQDDEHFASNQRLVHDITRTALFRALEIHHLLSSQHGAVTLATIDSFFEDRAKAFEGNFSALQKEFGKKRK